MVPGYTTTAVKRGHGILARLLPVVNEAGGWICGGFARWCASPVQKAEADAEDIDIFFPNRAALMKLVDILTVSGLCWGLVPDIFLSIRLHPNKDKWRLTEGRNLNIVMPMRSKWFVSGGSLEDVLKDFDFTVCAAAIQDKKTVICHPRFIEDEIKQRLVFQTVHDPYHEISKRIPKYAKKGYSIHHSQIVTLFKAWEQMEFERDAQEAANAVPLVDGPYRFKKGYVGRDVPNDEYAFHYRNWCHEQVIE